MMYISHLSFTHMLHKFEWHIPPPPITTTSPSHKCTCEFLHTLALIILPIHPLHLPTSHLDTPMLDVIVLSYLVNKCKWVKLFIRPVDTGVGKGYYLKCSHPNFSLPYPGILIHRWHFLIIWWYVCNWIIKFMQNIRLLGLPSICSFCPEVSWYLKRETKSWHFKIILRATAIPFRGLVQSYYLEFPYLYR